MSNTLIPLLRTRRFLPLFLTQFMGALNDNIFKNALVILITFVIASEAGLNAQLYVTMAAGIFILPFFLFSATAGQLADKYEKTRIIRMVKLVEIVLMLVATVGFFTHSVWLLMSVLFMMGMHSTFFGPLKYSILPDHLHEDELIGGNALVEAGTFLAILIGTIIGDLLILMPAGKWMVSGIIVAVALFGYASCRAIPPAPAPSPDLKVKWNIITETWRIIGFARQNHDVFLSIIGISWFWLVGATFLSQFPTFAKDVIGGDQTVVMFFMTLFSIGIGVGSAICNKLLAGEVTGTYVPYGAVGMAIFTVLLYLSSRDFAPEGQMINMIQFASESQHWLMIISLLGVSISGGIYIVPLYAIMQSRSAPEVRSRVIAANNVMNALFMVAAAIATVVMFESGFTVNHVFLAMAVVNFPVAWLVHKMVKQQQAARGVI